MNRHRGRLSGLTFGAIAALLVLGLALERVPALDSARQVVQARALPDSAFGSRKMLKGLNRIGVIHPDFRRATLPLWQRKDQPQGSHFLYGARRLAPEELPSSQALPESWRRREVPIVSLVLAPDHYRGLLDQANSRGRRWERFAYVSFFEGGELAFASGVGLRVHGGLSRLLSPIKSFRLYFRDELGASRVPAGAVLAADVPAFNRLVLHNDVRLDEFGSAWHFIRPLGYDIAERVGAPVPRTRPAWLLINGAPVGVYVLTEYLDENYLESRFGHDRFVLFRERKNPWDERLELGPEEVYRSFLGWLEGLPRRLTMEEAAERIDVENLSRWFLAVLFCGATDSLQGPAILDLTDPEARWRWITWDLDHAFKVEWGDKPGEDPWDVDVFGPVVVYSGREYRSEPMSPRSAILHRMMRSAQYRRYLADLFDEVMNHDLTADFLRRRYRHYVRLAADLDLDNSTFDRVIAEYIEKRPAILRRQLERHLEVGQSHRVEVAVAEDCPVQVDGRLKTADYAGAYFTGGTLRLKPGPGCAGRFAGWSIEGAVAEDPGRPNLRLEVTGDVRIRPRLRPQTG